MGTHDVLHKLNINYDSQEAIDLCGKIRNLSHYMHYISVFSKRKSYLLSEVLNGTGQLLLILLRLRNQRALFAWKRFKLI